MPDSHIWTELDTHGQASQRIELYDVEKCWRNLLTALSSLDNRLSVQARVAARPTSGTTLRSAGVATGMARPARVRPQEVTRTWRRTSDHAVSKRCVEHSE